MIPPGSQIGPITPEQRQELMASSLVAGTYETTVDRESAYEKLKGRAAQGADIAREMTEAASQGAQAEAGAATSEGGGLMDGLKGGFSDLLFGSTGPRGGRHDGLVQTAARSAVRTVGSAVGREIVRGVLGSLLGGSRRR